MKQKAIQSVLLVLCCVLGVSFASQNIQPINTQLNPQMAADGAILKMLGLLHSDLLNGQTQQNNYFNQYVGIENKKLLPKGNQHFLEALSLYPAFGQSYVRQTFPAVANLNTPEQSMGYEYVCSTLASLKDSRCRNRTPESGNNLFFSYDINRLMPFEGQALSGFTFSPDYADTLISTANNSAKGVSGRLNEFPAVSLAYHVLQGIGKQYDTAGEGTQSAGTQVSQMQKLHDTVQAPFSQKYINALSHASNPEVDRALTELSAEGNVMKYKQIKQGQSIQALLTAIMLQQLRTNRLLQENLTVLQGLANHENKL